MQIGRNRRPNHCDYSGRTRRFKFSLWFFNSVLFLSLAIFSPLGAGGGVKKFGGSFIAWPIDSRGKLSRVLLLGGWKDHRFLTYPRVVYNLLADRVITSSLVLPES